jgi:predicted ATPase
MSSAAILSPTPTLEQQQQQQQPFLKELLENRDSQLPSSPRTFSEEEMPRMNAVKMVDFEAPNLADSSGEVDLKAALKEMNSHPPIKRGESDDSRVSRLSGSTADMSSRSSFGDSSMSSLLSTSRLYGREQEEELLKTSFDRIVHQRAPCRPNLLLISGATGTGKTRLAESLESHVRDSGGFFCSGKFDQHQDDQFAPLCAAFNAYVTQLLQEADEETIRAARRRIRAAVEKDLCSLAKMIPPLQLLMEADLKTSNRSDEACERCDQKQGRSMFALNKLMRAICSPGRPIVMVLDDIQWATQCPLHKWRSMITDDMNEGIMFLGICRDDVTSTSEVSSFLRHLEQDKVDITNISIQNLQKPHIEDMINDVFLMPEDQSQSLATFVFDHSRGNAYFAVESLRMLQHDSCLLKYDSKSKTWAVNHNINICDQMMDYCPKGFVERKLRSIPRNTQKVFMAASCLGSNITERLLEVALQEPVGDRFQELVKKGKFVYDEGRKTYAFRHNSFQSVCYDLITAELQPAFHLEIGLRLWRHLDEEELDSNLFLVLNQLKQGATLMRDQKMRYDVAVMCINAGEKAAAQYAFPTASSYLRFAFVLLGSNHWEEAYDLSLVLHNYAAEVEFAQEDSERVDFLIEEVMSNAKNCEDKLRAYTTKIYVLGARGKTDEAIDIGICCLRMLGVHITPQCHQLNLAWASARIARKVRGKSDQMIKRLPHMQDSKKLAAMQILNLLFLNTYLGRRELFPFVVLKMMKLTFVDGISAISSVAFAGYGTLLCFSGQVQEGLRYGKLALELVDEWNAQSFQSRVGAFVWGSIFVHARPFIESLDQLREGHRLGLQTGDTEFAMLNADLHMMYMLDSGKFSMSAMIEQFNEFKSMTALHGHPSQLDALSPFAAAMKTFSDANGSLTDHSGELEDGIIAAKKNKNTWALETVYNTKLFLSFVAGDFKSAIEMIDSRMSHVSPHEGSIHEAFTLYVDGLVFFAEARRSINAQDTRKLLKRARLCIRLLKPLSRINPANTLGKLVLLEAEDAALMKKNVLAEEKYDHAASLASKSGSNFELAFAKQAAGQHFEFDDDKSRAISSFEDACKAYEAWGGNAAVTHLKQRIVQLRTSP